MPATSTYWRQVRPVANEAMRCIQWPARGGYLGPQHDAFKVYDPADGVPDVHPRVPKDRFDQRVKDLEVVEAARWSQANSGVTGQALEEAMQNEPWDPSVKGLTAVPQILQMMNGKPDWTQELGDAFLAQQPAVLDAVQRLRARASAAGYLKTTPQQRLARVAAPPPPGSSAPPATLYLIEPPTADEYSVPVYDRNLVYGTWPHPERPRF